MFTATVLVCVALGSFIGGVLLSNGVKAWEKQQEAKTEQFLSDEQKKALAAINDAKEKIKATL